MGDGGGTERLREVLRVARVHPRQRKPRRQRPLHGQVVGPGRLVHHPPGPGAHPGPEFPDALAGVREPRRAPAGQLVRVQVLLRDIDADHAEVVAVRAVFAAWGILLRHAFQSPFLVCGLDPRI